LKHVTRKVWIAGSDMNNAQDAIPTQQIIENVDMHQLVPIMALNTAGSIKSSQQPLQLMTAECQTL
jgi:hypothetical protein